MVEVDLPRASAVLPVLLSLLRPNELTYLPASPSPSSPASPSSPTSRSSPPDVANIVPLLFLAGRQCTTTLQIYLNDSFLNGCTTFFLPSSRPSTLNAFPVKPSQGCVLVFPHGDSRGSLLHEGSPVGEGGAKYVIRTEVLYDAYEQVPEGVVGGKEGEKDEGVEV